MLGMQGARGWGVDRLVAVVPLGPVPRLILAEDLAHRAGARSSLRGLGLGDDPISNPERHWSSFRLVPAERTAASSLRRGIRGLTTATDGVASGVA